jgi:hypothetical protein
MRYKCDFKGCDKEMQVKYYVENSTVDYEFNFCKDHFYEMDGRIQLKDIAQVAINAIPFFLASRQILPKRKVRRSK